MDNNQTHRDMPQTDAAVFSLTCRECDAGQGIASREEAIAQGWSEIEPAPELIEASFCGLCSNCKREEDAH